jgi:hypothetical protein
LPLKTGCTTRPQIGGNDTAATPPGTESIKPKWNYKRKGACRRGRSFEGLENLLLVFSGNAETVIADKEGQCISLQPRARLVVSPPFEGLAGILFRYALVEREQCESSAPHPRSA